ncbi:family 16 glycosylhydrolase [Candidatus Epulonipiscium viviparus]|uniref:family 16 glycosylhydrolase n=1 Tax=Candidatus Epulonipiscium viviparus TaxID=420336 RepID=UPI0027380D09|nr:family 16 glycosylhydrolase [Candidatus Epulopiscium viviparus]
MSKKLVMALALAMSFGVSAAEIGYDGSHITDKESKRGFVPHENYDLVYADEFDGDELNLDEWTPRKGQRYPNSQNYPENVSVQDGKLVVEFNYQDVPGDKATLTGGGVLSNKLFGYGYYEAKAKLFGDTGGLHSSFWVYGQNGDNKVRPKNNTIIEIDFYEIDSGKPNKIGTNAHYTIGRHEVMGLFSQDGVPVKHPEIDTSAKEFVMGVEWLPNQIKWYLDGELFRTVENPAVYGPQIMWLTALGSYTFDKEILFDKLPGESYWEYFRFYNIDLVGINMITNPSFEYNDGSDFEPDYKRDKKFPVGWYTKGKDMATATNVTMSKESYDGESILRHGTEKDYEVTTYIHVPFLPNETFTLTAMVRNPDGGNHTLTASGEGMAEASVAIPKTAPGVWQEVKLENIKVEKGEAVVGITSSAAAGQYLDVDSVSLVQVTGKPNHTSLEPFPVPEAEVTTGDIIVSAHLHDDRYKEIGSGFGTSGLKGYNGGSTRWGNAKADTYATWSPQLDKPGIYDIEMFTVSHPSRSANSTVEVFHADGVTAIPLNQQTTQGIVELGQFKLDENSYVKVSGAEGSGTLTFDTVIFKEEGSDELKAALKDGVAIQVDNNEGWIKGHIAKLDKGNSNVRLRVIDGVPYIPIEFMAKNFGGGDVTVEGSEISIFYRDKIIRYTQGSKVAKLGADSVEMDAACIIENGVWYAPAADIAEAFEVKAMNVNNQYYILSIKDIPEISNMEERMNKLF